MTGHFYRRRERGNLIASWDHKMWRFLQEEPDCFLEELRLLNEVSHMESI